MVLLSNYILLSYFFESSLRASLYSYSEYCWRICSFEAFNVVIINLIASILAFVTAFCSYLSITSHTASSPLSSFPDNSQGNVPNQNKVTFTRILTTILYRRTFVLARSGLISRKSVSIQTVYLIHTISMK